MWIRLPFVLAVGLPLVALRSPFPDALQLFVISLIAFGGARGLELLAKRTKFPAVIMIVAAVVALPVSILMRGQLEASRKNAEPARTVQVPTGPKERAVAPNETLPGRWRAVSLGESEGVAIAAADGVVHTWNARPTPYEPFERNPEPIAGTDGSEKVSVGFNHACALRRGQALCWGWNFHGEVGRPSTGTRDRADAPVVAEVPGVTFVDVSAGTSHTCGVDSAGAVWCWGANQYGECGAKPAPEVAPVRVAELPPAAAVRAGFHATCALSTDGRVLCWGDREFVGNGSAPAVFGETPVVVSGDLHVVDFDVGQKGGCAIDAEGEVTCWGRDAAPARLRVAGGVEVAGGAYHHCVARRDGSVVCWGKNWYGQLGDGTRRESTRPVVVRDVTGVRALAAGPNDACAIDGDGVMVCWGRFDHGRL